jgi:hypothetical protein
MTLDKEKSKLISVRGGLKRSEGCVLVHLRLLPLPFYFFSAYHRWEKRLYAGTGILVSSNWNDGEDEYIIIGSTLIHTLQREYFSMMWRRVKEGGAWPTNPLTFYIQIPTKCLMADRRSGVLIQWKLPISTPPSTGVFRQAQLDRCIKISVFDNMRCIRYAFYLD